MESVIDRPYVAQCCRDYVKNKVESLNDRPYAAQCCRGYVNNKVESSLVDLMLLDDAGTM